MAKMADSVASASKLSKKDIEAQIVDSFVEGRKLSNEGKRKVNAAKKFFASAEKTSFKSKSFIVTAEEEERMGFDKDAFIRDFGQALYDKYYVPKPCLTYKVTNR
jgi:hypothetical protein